MANKNKIDDLISYQEKWIAELNDTLDKLKKYRDGELSYNENQIDNVAKIQAQLSQAAKNIAESISSNLDKNK